MREQKVGFRSGRQVSVWLQHSWSCKWYFSCRFCKCKKKNNHLTQGQRLKYLNQMMSIYKKVIFFIPAKTPVLLKCLFVSRMTTRERDVISKWTKWSKYVLPFLVSRVPTLDFHVERYQRLVSFFSTYQNYSWNNLIYCVSDFAPFLNLNLFAVDLLLLISAEVTFRGVCVLYFFHWKAACHDNKNLDWLFSLI